jgi:hypothetical protein
VLQTRSSTARSGRCATGPRTRPALSNPPPRPASSRRRAGTARQGSSDRALSRANRTGPT